MADKIGNAVIRSVFLGIEDHGLLTAWVTVDHADGSTQGFGGYCLDGKPEGRGARVPHRSCGAFVAAVLRVAGASEWGKLVGKPVRVRSDENSSIVALGHFLKDDWFTPAVDMKD